MVEVLAEMSGGNPSAITTALIALGGAVIGGVITAGGQIIAEASRAKNERAREDARVERERNVAEAEKHRELVEAAIGAAQSAMTFFEALGPGELAQMHEYAEPVRSALWRLVLYLGEHHELVAAYDAVTQSFQYWNEVVEGSARSHGHAETPGAFGLEALSHRRPGRSSGLVLLLHRVYLWLGIDPPAWAKARRETRIRLTQFTDVAHRYLTSGHNTSSSR